jgi:hypothetical protein
VQTLKAHGCYCDGNGLCLQVSPTGAKSWVVRYASPDLYTGEGYVAEPQQDRMELDDIDKILNDYAVYFLWDFKNITAWWTV